jgi:hypothetical protein
MGHFTLVPPSTFPWEVAVLQEGVASNVIDVENPRNRRVRGGGVTVVDSVLGAIVSIGLQIGVVWART